MLNFEKRKWIINQLNKGTSVTYIAKAQSISRQAVYDIKEAHKKYGISAILDKQVGRPQEELPLTIRQRILNLRKQGHGIRRIEGLLGIKGINISHNKIHKFLTYLGMVILYQNLIPHPVCSPDPSAGRYRLSGILFQDKQHGIGLLSSLF